MKFSATLFLLASLVAAQGDEKQGNSTSTAPCVSKIECKINEEKNSADAAKKFEACASKTDAELTKCIYSALGLKDQQIEKIEKLEKPISKCSPTAETINTLTSCVGACTGDKIDDCVAKCMEPLISEYGKCIKKIAGKPDFDFNKSIECSSKCNQDSLSEIFDCDYSCNKELYDALTAKSGEDSLTEKDGKSGNSTDKSKDGKSGNSTDKSKGGNSSAMNNFGMNSFGAMAVGTILFALLV
jgi:hypothetical protein